MHCRPNPFQFWICHFTSFNSVFQNASLHTTLWLMSRLAMEWKHFGIPKRERRNVGLFQKKNIGLLPSVLLTYTSLQHSDLHPNYILVWAPYCYMRCSRGSCPYVLRLAWSPLWVWSQPVTPTPDMQQLKWRHNTEYYINTTMHHLLYWTPNRWPISCPPNHDQYLLFFT